MYASCLFPLLAGFLFPLSLTRAPMPTRMSDTQQRAARSRESYLLNIQCLLLAGRTFSSFMLIIITFLIAPLARTPKRTSSSAFYNLIKHSSASSEMLFEELTCFSRTSKREGKSRSNKSLSGFSARVITYEEVQ